MQTPRNADRSRIGIFRQAFRAASEGLARRLGAVRGGVAAGLALALIGGVEAAHAAPLPVPRPAIAEASPATPPPRRIEPMRLEPTRLGAPAAAPLPRGESARGLCADHRLEGEVIPEIEGPGYCGVPLPVRVDAVLGVKVSPPLTVNCRTARAFAAWMERGPIRAARRDMGVALIEVTISGTYSCRTRNFRTGGRLSEHAAGNAVDLTGFAFADGSSARLPWDWREGAAGAFLLSAWRAACGPFGTVLGPGHDEAHEDHFHFDTASRSSGPICR